MNYSTLATVNRKAAALLAAATLAACASNEGATGGAAVGMSPTGTPGAGPGAAGSGTGGLPMSPTMQPGAGGGMMPPVCHGSSINAAPVTPTVIAIIDRSGSMADKLDASAIGQPPILPGPNSRWVLMRRVLVGGPDPASATSADSLLKKFDALVRFGAHFYTAGDPLSCPDLKWVPPADNNYQTIRDVYLEGCTAQDPVGGCMLLPGGGTPTASALKATTDLLVQSGDLGPPGPDQMKRPVVYILATDGAPNGCQLALPQPGMQSDEQRVESETQRAFDLEAKTFVLSMVRNDPAAEEHLQRVANLGVGLPADGPMKATYWMPKSSAELGMALSQIINQSVSCDIKLDKGVMTMDPSVYCKGTVVLNSQPLACQDPNGWDLVDSTTVRLQGAACDALRAGQAIVDASFPCGVPITIL